MNISDDEDKGRITEWDHEKQAEMFLQAYGTNQEWEEFQHTKDYIDFYYSDWLSGKKGIDSDVGETVKLCAHYSPTWLSIMIDDPEKTGGWISLAFTPFPEETSGFKEIYPQDIAIYCARIDALRHPDKQDEIRKLFPKLHYDDGFQKFPKATARLVVSGFINRIKAKIFFWKTPKWERVRNELE